jgi:hypothetical protein
MKKCVTSLLAFMGISLYAGVSSAAGDFLCIASYSPAQSISGFGNDGYMYIEDWTGPDCTGSFQHVYFVCSDFPTSSSCPLGSQYWYRTEAKMLMIVTKIIDAAQWNLPVGFQQVTCVGGQGGCLGLLSFL